MERPYRCIRQDFFLARRFRDLEDLNRQFDAWRREVANARRHAATRRIVAERFAEEQAALLPHPAIPCSAVLTVERRVGKDGMISVGGNLYSVPDATRRRVLEVQTHPRELRIFEDGSLIAAHPAPEGRNRRRDPLHRKLPLPQAPRPPEQPVGRRPPDFHEAVGRRLAAEGTAR